MAAAGATRLFAFACKCRCLFCPNSPPLLSNSNFVAITPHLRGLVALTLCISTSATTSADTLSSSRSSSESNKKKKIRKKKKSAKQATMERNDDSEDKEDKEKRTRSEMEFDLRQQHYDVVGLRGHIPVMLGEVLQVFNRPQAPLRSFVDCTLGAAGHSSAIIQEHPELQLYVGLDVDPLAHKKARAHMNMVLNKDSGGTLSDLKACTRQKNFKDIKSVLREVDEKYLIHGIDGILMDLGVSSMQVNNADRGFSVLCDGPLDMRMNPKVNNADRGFSVLCDGPLDMRMNPKASLKAEDILNSWPEEEVGRILRDYGEESNWRHLQNKIVKARLHGGLHSTGELVNLVRSMSPMSKGRQGWVKTATRVFQALRIAVNDELKTLEHALHACFDCLSYGGRLAVISFHSLEDRIVKQTFLDIINISNGDGFEDKSRVLRLDSDVEEEQVWVRQKISGTNGTILTKRPITPSEEEERLNRRCRSAKLRVIQKMRRL